MTQKAIINFYMLVTVLCLYCNDVVGQNFESVFGDSTTAWSIIPFGACDAICNENYTVNGDTIINSQNYAIVENLGYLREDTVSGKLWFYDDFYASEFLISDLSLSLNDTFYVHDFSSQWPYIVDSVYYVNSSKHIRLTCNISMCTLMEQLVFIEGSGTNAGLKYQGYLNGDLNSYMLCHEKDMNTSYGNFLFQDSCTICMVSIDENEATTENVSLHPNPAKNIITVEFENTLSRQLKLIDINGRLVKQEMISTKLHQIDLRHLSPGTYILNVTNQNRTESYKVVIEN